MQETLGLQHPDVSFFYKLTTLRSDQGDVEQAMENQECALVIMQRYRPPLGPQYPYVAISDWLLYFVIKVT